MQWDQPRFPFVAWLEKHHHEIRSEAERLRPDEFVDWPLKEAYRGAWKAFCLLSRDPDWILASQCIENAKRCPRTVDVLEGIPGIVRGGFSLLMPGAHIFEHRDASGDTLRCHLGLTTNPDAAMRFGDQVIHWRAGRCMVFDGSHPHEAANLGNTPRLVCLVDVERRALEMEVPA